MAKVLACLLKRAAKEENMGPPKLVVNWKSLWDIFCKLHVDSPNSHLGFQVDLMHKRDFFVLIHHSRPFFASTESSGSVWHEIMDYFEARMDPSDPRGTLLSQVLMVHFLPSVSLERDLEADRKSVV